MTAKGEKKLVASLPAGERVAPPSGDGEATGVKSVDVCVTEERLEVRRGRPPGKLGTLAVWAGNFLRGRSWVLDLNVVATNRCTQSCPMCNSYVLAQAERSMLTAADFRRYLEKLAPYRVAACTISGGEPTIVPEMPEILVEAQRAFPFGVTLISNFYGSTRRIMRVMETALRLGISISCSFDGFGEGADKQRGATKVAEQVLRHLKLVLERKRELGSSSPITVHTVLSDFNVWQYGDIVALVKELGVRHTVAPVNDFGYVAANLDDGREFPSLTPSAALEEACRLALASGHLVQSHAFVRGIPAYARKEGAKVCPYLTPGLKRFKLFLEPNGDISLCDRRPIGNLDRHSLEEMFGSQAYAEEVKALEACPGCWLTCFVELPLSFRPSSFLSLDFLHRRTPPALR